MDLRAAYLALAYQLRDMSPEAAAQELVHRARLYEIHRATEPMERALYLSLARATKKRRRTKKNHDATSSVKTSKKRAHRGTAWNTLDRYRGEILRLHGEGYGARRLEQWLWKAHHQKVSYRTILNWLAEKKSDGGAS